MARLGLPELLQYPLRVHEAPELGDRAGLEPEDHHAPELQRLAGRGYAHVPACVGPLRREADDHLLSLAYRVHDLVLWAREGGPGLHEELPEALDPRRPLRDQDVAMCETLEALEVARVHDLVDEGARR